MPEITARLSTALAGRYTTERELGAGGMATVYLAHDVKHNRRVAVKVLKPELAAVLGSERFLKEIEVTANLQHPRILPFRGTRRAETGVGYTRVEGRRLFHAMLGLPAQRAWRFRLVAFLEAVYGVRANQTVQLRWDDVNFDREYCVALPNGKTVELVGTITFRKDALGSKGQPDRAMPMLPVVPSTGTRSVEPSAR